MDDGLIRKGWKCSDLHREMKKRGYEVKLRSLQRYRSQETKPGFKTTKQILECLDIEATDEMIEKLLENSEKSQDYQFSKLRYIERGIRLKISRLSDKLDDEGSILMALNDRMYSTQGLTKANFNRYVTMLIRKDIDEHILPTVKDKRRNKR